MQNIKHFACMRIINYYNYQIWPYLCSALQQLLGNVYLAVDRRQVEAGPAGRVPGVGVGAHLQQVAHQLLGALPRRQQQGSPQLAIRGAHITSNRNFTG